VGREAWGVFRGRRANCGGAKSLPVHGGEGSNVFAAISNQENFCRSLIHEQTNQRKHFPGLGRKGRSLLRQFGALRRDLSSQLGLGDNQVQAGVSLQKHFASLFRR
jgi:hypothetical protein